MLEGVHFYYDGIYSVDMGLLNVKLSGGMFEETFLPEREIKEIKISGRDKPYFQGIDYKSLEFELNFAFEYYYDEQKIREVARWLNQSYYKPFYTTSNVNRIYYCMVDGDSKLIHNGLRQGYITLKFRCDSPYSYTGKYTDDNIEYLSTKETIVIDENTFTNEMGTTNNIAINSNGDLAVQIDYKPFTLFSGMKWSDL